MLLYDTTHYLIQAFACCDFMYNAGALKTKSDSFITRYLKDIQCNAVQYNLYHFLIFDILNF